MMETIGIIKSIGYFLLAGLFEIGGGVALIGVGIIMYWPRS
jgi:drug/metabolite transporter superfamily protein YnfA